MANQAQFLLQVSDFTLAGIDKTIRNIIVRGAAIPVIVPGSLNTLTVVAGGSNWVVGDLFTLPGGGVGKVTDQTAGAATTAAVVYPGGGLAAGTGLAAIAVPPSIGTGLTITTTVNTGNGGLLIITGFSIASSVVTFNCTAPGGGSNTLTGGGGQSVVVQGFSGTYAFLNGLYTTTAATASTFTAAVTAPNVGQTTVYATATVQPQYVSGGVNIGTPSFSFVDQIGKVRPIAGLGFNPRPTWLSLQTRSGSALKYETNLASPYPLVRIFSMAATAGEVAAGALPADVITFRAEFTQGGM